MDLVAYIMALIQNSLVFRTNARMFKDPSDNILVDTMELLTCAKDIKNVLITFTSA